MITLEERPNEKGTAVFTIAFTDEDENAVVPNTAAWQLMKTDGTIVNERSFENCSFTGDAVVLSGDDLQLFDNDSKKRVFAIHATYNSTAGDDLPLNDEVMFKITDLVSQT
jgi:hypothetical protein